MRSLHSTYTTRKMSELLSIELLHRGEDDRLCWHVQSDRESLGRKQNLDQTFLEQNLDDLLEKREKSSVMNTDTTSKEGEDVSDLGKLFVLVIETAERVVEDILDRKRFLFLIHVDFGHLHGKGFAFALGECKDNDWVQILDHDHLDQLVDIGSFACGGTFA